MKIWQKTLLPPLVAMIGLTVIGSAVIRIGTAKDAMKTIFVDQAKTYAGLGANRLAFAKRHAEAQMLIFTVAKMEEADRLAATDRLERSLARFVELVKADVDESALHENEKTLLSELDASVKNYSTEVKAAAEMAKIDIAIGLDSLSKAVRLQEQIDNTMQALLSSVQSSGRENEGLASDSVSTQILVALIAAGVTLLLLLVMSGLMTHQIVKPLRALAVVARRIAAGDLDSTISMNQRDETGDVLRAFAEVKDRLQQFEHAQLAMAAAHEAGDIDHRIDTTALPGAYGTLAGKVNELVDAHIGLNRQFIAVINDYARGEFAADMPQLPGKKAQITDAAFGVKRSLAAIAQEIDQLVAAASVGDFTARGNAAGYEAKFADMVSGLNTLMATCEAGLSDANRMFSALAHGDLSARIEADYQGMFEVMKNNANQGMASMSELIARIRQASESVSVASAEIARGNTDLSARTESQAASLQQTTASIEELTGTVQQNASSAREAKTLANNASAIATKGGATVHQVVATMGRIEQSSKRIQDIISVIDGIAFQTNILALNAAVEAARAGEQGRGFAVVASEVRNLAQRSAAAAKEIKALITESAGEVGSGTALVSTAGTQMEEIVAAVRRVTEIIAEIAAASAEQASGIEQVNHAIGQMDQTTQQNAALVEEASAAAEALNGQADDLALAVAAFKLAISAQTNERAHQRVAPVRAAA